MNSQLLSSYRTVTFTTPLPKCPLPNSLNNHPFLPNPIYPHSFKTRNSLCSVKPGKNPNFIVDNFLTTTQQNELESESETEFVKIKKDPNLPPYISSWCSKFSLTDQVFFLFTFIAFTTAAGFVSFVAAAVPALYAMGKAANSFAKLADAARKELPETMAAVRLSGMEVSDLTLELSDLSQEVSEGVNKSVQAVEAAKVGIQQLGSRTRERIILMIEERANLPTVSLQTIVSGAAKKTSHAARHAAKAFLNLISGGVSNSEDIS